MNRRQTRRINCTCSNQRDTTKITAKLAMTQDLVEGQMYPLTVRGLEEGMNFLSK